MQSAIEKAIQHQNKIMDSIYPPHIRELAENFNQIRKNLKLDEIDKITNQFKGLGIEKKELDTYIPTKLIEKPKSLNEIETELNIEFLRKRINSLDNEEKLKSKWFWRGAVATFIAASIGIVPLVIQMCQNKPQNTYMKFPKVVIVDTVIVRK
ncbi:MAG TPA: hypothetical protein VF411_11510 [Bacteroidia bacterium]